MDRIGLQSNPIYINQDEDDETKNDFNDQLQIARNKALLEQSQLTNQPIQICFALCKTKVKGDFAIKNRIINKAIIEFFQEHLKIKITSEHFCPKIEPDYSNPQTVPLKNQLILHGVDFISTAGIKDKLQTNQVKIQKIIWVDDSNCKIVLQSNQDAQKLIKSHSLGVKVQEDDEQANRGWISIKPYSIYNFQRQLCTRYATSMQILPKKQSFNYMAFLEAKKSLPIHLLQKFKAYDDYVNFIREVERKILERKKKYSFKNKSRSRQRQNKRRNRNQSYQRNNLAMREQYNSRNRVNRQQNDRSRRFFLFEQNTPVSQPNQLMAYGSAEKGLKNRDQSYIQTQKQQVGAEQNNKLDTSFKVSVFSKYKTIPDQGKASQNIPQKKISYDRLSNYDSQLSFNDFGAPIATVNNVFDRLDYSSDAQSNHSATDELADIFGNIITSKAVGKTLLDTSFQMKGDNSNEQKNHDLSFKKHQKDHKISNLDFSIDIGTKKNDKSFTSEKSSKDYSYKNTDFKNIKKPIVNYDFIDY